MGPMFGQKNVFILMQHPKEHVFFLGHVRAMLAEQVLKRTLLRPQIFGAPSFLVLLIN